MMATLFLQTTYIVHTSKLDSDYSLNLLFQIQKWIPDADNSNEAVMPMLWS